MPSRPLARRGLLSPNCWAACRYSLLRLGSVALLAERIRDSVVVPVSLVTTAGRVSTLGVEVQAARKKSGSDSSAVLIQVLEFTVCSDLLAK